MKTETPPAPIKIRTLSTDTWQANARRHVERLQPWVDEHLQRQSLGKAHPVYDFLFEYYSFRPGQLLTWSPGWGYLLEGAGRAGQPAFKEGTWQPEGTLLDTSRFPRHRVQALDWLVDFLRNTMTRPARLGCHGLHEWAMVYEEGDIRHRAVPLRLPREALKAVVESQPVCCTHYDAFRFFSPSARPLNRFALDRATQKETEQRGCLHVNMDLYKWAYKFYPWTPSDLIADAFRLALRIREIDMRASPYHLEAFGFPPIPIETGEGRAEYLEFQRAFAEEAQPLRARLLEHYQGLRAALRPDDGTTCKSGKDEETH